MSQGTSRRNRDNYWEEVKGTDPGYRSRSVRICVQALKSILEVMDEMDVAKLNKVYEDNEARFSKLEDELDEIEKVRGLAIAQVTSGCFTSNKARLCHNHLANCKNFKLTYTKEEVERILSCSVPGDLKNN
ncbi:3831_t:CDS:2, partial [Entrophospora sp. SA101]